MSCIYSVFQIYGVSVNSDVVLIDSRMFTNIAEEEFYTCFITIVLIIITLFLLCKTCLMWRENIVPIPYSCDFVDDQAYPEFTCARLPLVSGSET